MEARFATREGSVLIVVIGMLLLLMLIGFTFFTFSSQEQSSAEYYADAAKVYSPADPNILFDWALEQLIIGPHDVNTQSVLWPGKHSLVPNMLGMFTYNQNGGIASDQPTQPTDRHSYNGGWGINVISGPQGQPYIDQNFDGQNDPNNVYPLLAINWSPAATGPAGYNNVNNRQGFLQQIANSNIPQIDVGYTYSDINNVFLAHVGYAPQSSLPLNNSNYVAPLFVATPSFHRPQYLRDINSGVPLSNWYNSPATVTQVMRPHPSHVIVGQNGLPLLGVQ